jgi:uncharacterized protein with FMN-binding domain
LKGVKVNWNVQAKPWKEGRIEIRRLLGLNQESARKQAIRLTWDYLQKNDIGDGHEYGMYMYLGGEPVWAVKVYQQWLPKQKKYFPVFGYRALSALYAEFGEFAQAKKTLDVAMREIPKHAMPTMRKAELNDSYGDMYVAWGKDDLAKRHYAMAAKLYPQSKPKYGRHLLPRRAKKVQAKLDALSLGSFSKARLKDGQYRETALGYSGDIRLTVHVQRGRVAKIDVKHQEKIDQNVCVLIPKRIVDEQSLKVDGISGATVTKDAIVSGTFRALKKSGLK